MFSNHFQTIYLWKCHLISHAIPVHLFFCLKILLAKKTSSQSRGIFFFLLDRRLNEGERMENIELINILKKCFSDKRWKKKSLMRMRITFSKPFFMVSFISLFIFYNCFNLLGDISFILKVKPIFNLYIPCIMC